MAICGFIASFLFLCTGDKWSIETHVSGGGFNKSDLFWWAFLIGEGEKKRYVAKIVTY